MRKMMVAIMVLVFLGTALPIFAETLSSPSGDPKVPVIVFKTEDLMDYGIKHINKGGDVRDPTFLKTIRALVPSGTRCSVIKSGWTRKKVRILEGRFEGAVGWVPTEMVKP
ncbi:MAG: hypothetical protein P8X65_13855 [Syntrophobacterales bacterium]|jgi:hypothetical protein